jgi:ribosomal protein L5
VVKVTVNRGLGEAATNAKSLEASVNELAQITGQKVVSRIELITEKDGSKKRRLKKTGEVID